jgi:UDP-glucose 4-epimerase
MRVLVTGGAGYIGSHTCVELLETGHEVFVVDNLCNGHEAALERVRSITNCELKFMNADIRDSSALDNIFNTFKPETVIHFAGLKAVGESVVDPLKYYNVNVCGSISLLEAMNRAGCKKIIFSSSATVYGIANYLPFNETHPASPINPYGRTKLMVENILRDWITSNSQRSATVLRYFNPVGAHQSGKIGEYPQGIPNNLMPFITQVAVGKLNRLMIFGNDYDTEDGTGSRDYIHVMDLASAHLNAAQFQCDTSSFNIFNIGCGHGTTVLELLESFERASGVSIDYEFVARRDGDTDSSWADATQAKKLLHWKPIYNIDQMCEDTWRWQKNNPDGYKL